MSKKDFIITLLLGIIYSLLFILIEIIEKAPSVIGYHNDVLCV